MKQDQLIQETITTDRGTITETQTISETQTITAPETKIGFWSRVWDLYSDGFRNMTIGRYLWAIILAKLVILFVVFKLFFFPNLLSRDYDNDEDRAQAVRTHLCQPE